MSEAAAGFQPDPGLDAIMDASISWNRRVRITGVLIYSSGYFAQYLEGARKEVDALLSRIAADARHHSLQVTGRIVRERRLFPRWSLAYSGDAGFVRNEVSGLFESSQHGRGSESASNRMLSLMHDFVVMRRRLGPSVH